jgi:NAD(P)-dependent dehydrogenase (short-subunit alcohol dehydrogenase family)
MRHERDFDGWSDAIERMTDGLALEYKPLNILVKTVASGAYMTTAFGSSNDNEDSETGAPELIAYAEELRDHLIRGREE